MKIKTSPYSRPAFALAAALLFGGMLAPGAFSPASAQAAPLAPLPLGAPYAPEINAFGAADRKQMPPAGAVLFIGSSSIRYWTTLAQDFPEIPVINRGFGGSLIQDSTRYANRIAIPYKPKMIILCAGTNDLAYGGKNPQQVLGEFQDFVRTVHAALPDTRIVYLAINPTVARWKQEPNNLEANCLIEKFVVETNSPAEEMSFIDPHMQLLTADDQPQPRLLRSDGLHFNTAGYKVWTALIKPRVLALAALDGVRRLDAPKP
jgi:lysophospholipase L1-like esterase